MAFPRRRSFLRCICNSIFRGSAFGGYLCPGGEMRRVASGIKFPVEWRLSGCCGARSRQTAAADPRRRSMNIRALTARRDALDAAQQDLFAHIIVLALRRRRAERRAVCREGCNSLYVCKHIFSGAAIDEYSCSDGGGRRFRSGSTRSVCPYSFGCAPTTWRQPVGE